MNESRFHRRKDQDVDGPIRDFVGYGRYPPEFLWPNDAAVAVQLVVNYEEGSELSWPMGDRVSDGLGEVARTVPDGVRDLTVESTYEYGSRAGIWRLMRAFDEAQVKVTFFAAAVALEKNPALALALVSEGHEPCSHGFRWLEPFLMTMDEEREAVRLAVESIRMTCGQRPVGWYSRYGPSNVTRKLLIEEGGFLYDADACNDDLPYYTDVDRRPHLVVPYCLDANDSRFVRGTGFANGRDFADYLLDSVSHLRREASTTGTARLLSVGLHPRLSGRPGRTEGLRRFLHQAQIDGGVWFARRDEIARFWRDRFPPTGHE